MPATFTLVDHWNDGKRLHFQGTVAFTTNYASGGETLDLSDSLLPVQGIPLFVWLKGEAGFVYEYTKGTNMSDGKAPVRQEAAAVNPAAELPVAAYPAGVTGDTVELYGIAKAL